MSEHHYTNLQIAALFKKMAAAYQILNENRFKIIAYERAADSIEHLTSEVKDLWDDKKLKDIPGVGDQIIAHLDELFRTGKNKHFDATMAKVPQGVFPLLNVPGIGPKRAYKLVTELKLHNEKSVVDDLQKAAKKGKIAPMEGFGEKSEEDILKNIEIYKKGSIKENRITLAEADMIAAEILSFMKKHASINQIDALGSLRRRVATIGDIDISILSDKPKSAIEHFCSYPNQKIIEKGPTGASILLHNGRQVDLRVQEKKSYGAMLQYFTGSKNHNIQLRTYALSKGYSLSEYGIKKTKSDGKVMLFDNEKDFYNYLGMQWIPPELREDRGEIAAALQNKLPALVEEHDIKGDFHIHTSFNLEPSHDLGADSIEDILDTASLLNYQYIGVSDHNPSVSQHTEAKIIDIMKRRKEFYLTHTDKWNEKHHRNIHVFVMLEVDIDPEGHLSLPEKAFDSVDAVIASIHSSFQQDRASMTSRLIRALSDNQKVKIIGHPTGRLLGKREGYEVDWMKIFEECKKRDVALEINSSPYRLDLPDSLVFDAIKHGVRFVVNSDAHAKGEMMLMPYGVTVARRGWSQKRDIYNTSSYNEIIKWLT